MRIFDPKDQLGNSLLSQADTQRSSVKLEKQMAVGGGAITLTSADISDIENWELSNARVKVDGQMISFLPDTSRDEYGNITIDFGERFENVILVLKRVDFGGVITIEVKIQQLMAKTLATAGKNGYDANANITQWKALGEESYKTDPVEYKAAKITHWDSENPPFELGATVEESFLSLQTTSLYAFGGDEGPTVWKADLPCLRNVDNSPFAYGPIEVFDAKMPNLVDGFGMFVSCTNLTSFSSEIPSLTNAFGMFDSCERLKSWNVELPNGLTNASNMFEECRGLISFSTPSGTLPNSLTTVSCMFNCCYGLKEFTPSLAGLTNCEDFGSMFWNCILNEDSIENILNTLPDRKNKGRLTIDIGGDTTMEASVKQQLSSLAQSVSTAKNWNIALTWNTPPTV